MSGRPAAATTNPLLGSPVKKRKGYAVVAASGRKLVIVESPTKVKSLSSYLGSEYDVEASVGHIRDLPNPSELPADMKKGPFGKFAIDVDADFEPYYVVDADKRKKVAELKRLLKDAVELYLATDEDREGEAIAWHLNEVLRPKVPVKRMVFHEITREAIQRAVHNTRDLDQRMVDAQETRRLLDRLYGYEVSPVLWRKVRQGLSAGRVQSVVTRMVVERERERMAFVAAGYWDVSGRFTPDVVANAFEARLTGVDGRRVATGRDFTDAGELRGDEAKVCRLAESGAREIAEALPGAAVRVTSVAEKPYTRRPHAPFITSTLQQEASRKLRMSSKTSMRVAQRLYENGYITYMRTDSTSLSESALAAARSQARDLYGAAYVPDAPRRYDRKVKNAQEAHEAIRPAGETFRTPAQVAGALRGEEFALYELIWKRTIASQMADARGSTATLKLGATLAGLAVGSEVEFTASGTVITFRGFLAAYEEGRDEDRGASDEERRLPKLAEGAALEVLSAEADGHETAPPPRYTEASLVRAMEERGIGRPSTFAATVGTIQDRGYVFSRGSALIPTWLAFAVTRLLEEHFSDLVDYDFTARMEDDLDLISRGDEQRVAWLKRFYFGDEAKSIEGLRNLVADLGEIDAREISTIRIGDGIVVRVGRYGPYVEDLTAVGVDVSTGEVLDAAAVTPRRATIPDDIAPDELTPDKARDLLERASDDGRILGRDPLSGNEIVAKAGRYGPYVSEVLTEEAAGAPARGKVKVKPRTASLFKDMDLATVDLDTAVKLLSLPRVVGVDPEGAEITAQNGRYGPYLKRGTDSRSLATEAQIFDITLEEALAIYAQPKTRGARTTAPLRELGPDPVSGKPMVIKDGRFGPYVTDGDTNATLRKGDEPESMTLERGAELLAEKRAKGPTTRPRTAKKTAARTTSRASKTAASRTSAKATAARTAASKTAASKTAASKTAASKTATKTAARKTTAAKRTPVGG